MGFDGGGGNEEPQVTNVPRQRSELEGDVENVARDQLIAVRPYALYGAGYQMANQSPFAQIYTPGPNQTNFGDPYTVTGHQPYFGNQAQAPANIGFNSVGGGEFGGYAQGGGGSGNYKPQPQSSLPAGSGYTSSSGLLGILQSALGTQSPNGQPFTYTPQQQAPIYRGNTSGNPSRQQPTSSSQSQSNNQQQQVQQSSTPAPAGPPPDPWAGTINAVSQDNPGTNWNPDGTYNPNGPYTYAQNQMNQQGVK